MTKIMPVATGSTIKIGALKKSFPYSTIISNKYIIKSIKNQYPDFFGK